MFLGTGLKRVMDLLHMGFDEGLSFQTILKELAFMQVGPMITR